MNHTEQTVEGALAGVRDELAKHGSGVGTVSTPEQLWRFESQLLGMLEDLRQGTFQPDRTSMAHIVVDSWPLGHELANRVCAAVDAYSRRFLRDQHG